MLQTILHRPDISRPSMLSQHPRSSQDGDCYISSTCRLLPVLPLERAGHRDPTHRLNPLSNTFAEAWGRYAQVKHESRDGEEVAELPLAAEVGSTGVTTRPLPLAASDKSSRRALPAHLHVPSQGQIGLHVASAWGLRPHPYVGHHGLSRDVTRLSPDPQRPFARSPNGYPDMEEVPVPTLNVPQFNGQYPNKRHQQAPDHRSMPHHNPYNQQNLSDDEDVPQEDQDTYTDYSRSAIRDGNNDNNSKNDSNTEDLDARNSFRFSAPPPQSRLSPLSAVNQPRAKREFVPEHKKDATYWSKRLKNNDSARRSRIKRKTMEKIMEHRMAELQKENVELRCELNALKRMLGEQLTSDLKTTKPAFNSCSSSSPSSIFSLTSTSPLCLLNSGTASGYDDQSNSSSASASTEVAAVDSGTKNSDYGSSDSRSTAKEFPRSPGFRDEIEFPLNYSSTPKTIMCRTTSGRDDLPFPSRMAPGKYGRSLEAVSQNSPFLTVEGVQKSASARSSRSDSGIERSPSRSPCSSEGSADCSSSSSSSSHSSSSIISCSNNSGGGGMFQSSEDDEISCMLGSGKRSTGERVDIDLLQKIPLKFRIKRGLQPIAADSQLSRDGLK